MENSREGPVKGVSGLSFEELKNLSPEEQKKLHSKIKALRQKAKILNFSATYKIGAEALSRNSGMPLDEAKKLLRVYWERNSAILKVENSLVVKTVQGGKWLKNPVSGFWYSLRVEKDRFSTLNQGKMDALYKFA